MKILLIPNSTIKFDFKKLFNSLKNKHNVKILIWHNELNNFFKFVEPKNKIIFKDNLYWDINNYHEKKINRGIFENFLQIYQERKKITRLFSKENFKTVVSFGDRELSFNLIVLYLAKIKKIKIFLNTNFRSGNINDMINRRLLKRKYSTVSKFNLIRYFFSKQFKEVSKNKFISFYYKQEIIYYYLFNILPKNPWVIGGGNSDYIFTENHIVKENYVKLGCDKKKLLLSHSYNSKDISLNINKKKIKKKFLILISQNYEHGDETKDENKIKVYTFCKKIFHICKKHKYRAEISLHPKQKREDYKWIEKKFKFKILKTSFAKNLYKYNYIISEKPSSIIDWALILNIHYIILDEYKTNFKLNKKYIPYFYSNSDKVEKFITVNEKLNKSQNTIQLNNYFKDHKDKIKLINELS